jgi:hypothetical protein
MAVSGFKISEIPEIRAVCTDFFRIMPQILLKTFQIAPDGFWKIGNLLHILQKKNKQDSTPALTSRSNSAGFADPWA